MATVTKKSGMTVLPTRISQVLVEATNEGLTDCISFIVMEDHGLTDALTTDEHFQQAAFRALLRENMRDEK